MKPVSNGDGPGPLRRTLREAAVDARLDDFFAEVARAPHPVLMLDYDGTLAPFRIDPQNAMPYPGVCELLDAIGMQTGTRLAIISGRWLRDLLGLLRLRRLPELWGTHGREHFPPGGPYRFVEPAAGAYAALFRADTWEPDIRAAGGRVERKPASLAIHWRGLSVSRVERIRALVQERWHEIGADGGIERRDFDGGIEVLASGISKATAVNAILAQAGGAPAAYLGDDRTDEDALRTIRGRGIGVLVAESRRDSAADAWVQPPQGVRDFLGRWLDASRRG
ncbi:MAG: trehalose-phosphatase [Gammaproteobacteria bacterium]